MWSNNKVLVIDDNSQRRYDLKIVLDFLGEAATVSGSADWQANVVDVPKGDFIAVFIGDFAQSAVPLGQLLKFIRAWSDETSVVLMGDHHLDDNVEEVCRHMVIATLSIPPTYNKLVDTLHRAQLFREAQSVSKRQAQRRPVHLFRSLVGTSREIQQVREMMSQVA